MANVLASSTPKPVSFWHFAGAVLVGSLSARAAGYIAKQALANDPEQTRQTAATIAGISAFWLFGGMMWVALARQPSD